jgi:hypothetical protein
VEKATGRQLATQVLASAADVDEAVDAAVVRGIGVGMSNAEMLADFVAATGSGRSPGWFSRWRHRA